MDQVLSNYKIRNPPANLDLATEKEKYIYVSSINILFISIQTLCSYKTYCKNKILSSPDPNRTDCIVVIFPEYTGTSKCTFSHRI